jgi:hypothetical protein
MKLCNQNAQPLLMINKNTQSTRVVELTAGWVKHIKNTKSPLSLSLSLYHSLSLSLSLPALCPTTESLALPP